MPSFHLHSSAHAPTSSSNYSMLWFLSMDHKEPRYSSHTTRLSWFSVSHNISIATNSYRKRVIVFDNNRNHLIRTVILKHFFFRFQFVHSFYVSISLNIFFVFVFVLFLSRRGFSPTPTTSFSRKERVSAFSVNSILDESIKVVRPGRVKTLDVRFWTNQWNEIK